MYIETLILFLLFLYYFYILSRKSRKKINKNGLSLPPGPSGLPVLGYLPFLGKVPYLTITDLAKKYGKMYTLPMGEHKVIILNDFQLIKEAMKLDALQGRHQISLFEPRGYTGLGLLEGKDWVEVKRFALKHLRDMGFGKRSAEGLIQEQVQDVCKYLQKNLGKPVYLKHCVELAVINSFWTFLTSEKFDIEDPNHKKVAEVLSEGFAEANIVGIASFLPWLAKMFPNLSGYNKGLEYFGAPEQMAKRVVTNHINTYNANNERDLVDAWLSKIYSTNDPNSQFYKEVGIKNLHFTLLDLFFAGSDTMSSTIGWTLLYLAYFPHVQKKVYDEIDDVIGRKREPCLDDRPKMPYLEAMLYEVLRKSSMVPLGLFHAAIEDCEFNGYYIPKRTILLCNLWNVHHEKEYWGDPEEFRPERFLENGKFRKDEHVIPFMIGKRSCPGESLALLEYFLFITGILQKFHFALDPNSDLPDISPKKGWILPPPKHNLIVYERK